MGAPAVVARRWRPAEQARVARLKQALAIDDPTNEIGAARGVKELLRQLLAAPTAHDARHRLARFYHAS